MDVKEIIDLEDKHDSRQFNKKIPITRGEGAMLFDHEGNGYVDCVGGHGVSILGYSHPRITKALCGYLKGKKPITCGHFYDENRAMLMEKLVSLTPANLNRIFFANSGTESVEAGLKFAMKYKKQVKDKEIIAMKRGFHGRSLGALATTYNPRYRQDYSVIPGVSHASYNKIDSVEELVTDNTVAIITELIQGESGVFPASDEFPSQLRKICDEKNIVLIFDEVQTGFGRTAKLFALEHWNVAPDILCLAKGIAAGVPMSATITSDKIMNAVNPGGHGTTFGGNPFACKAAVESLNIIEEEKLLQNASTVSTYLFKELNAIMETHDVIKDVRGKGLMIGIQFRQKVKQIIKKLQENGILALTAGFTVVRLLPPLVITKDQAKLVIEALEKILE